MTQSVENIIEIQNCDQLLKTWLLLIVIQPLNRILKHYDLILETEKQLLEMSPPKKKPLLHPT